MILVTGATSQLGRCVVQLLLERGRQLRCFLIDPKERKLLPNGNGNSMEIFYGNLQDREAVLEATEDIESVIHIAGIRFAPDLVPACEKRGIRRGIFISSAHIYSRFDDELKRQIQEGEQAVTQSGLEYTILRPTMIYGYENDRNISRLVSAVRRLPAFPLFGGGKNLVQPVFVWDLALVVVNCLEEKLGIGKIYDLGGPEPLSYRQVLKEIANALDKKVPLLSLPIWSGILMSRFWGLLGTNAFYRPEQLRRLAEDRTVDIGAAREELGFSPRSFAEGLQPLITLLPDRE